MNSTSDGTRTSHDAAEEPIANSPTLRPPPPPAPADAASTAPPDPLVGTVIAERYRLVRRVGEGGMGAVYLGEHLTLRKRVAVKFLHAEMSRIAEVVARFEREAQAAARLDHPNVVAAHDFGKTADGVFFLVMEFVEGGSLRDLLERTGRLAPVEALHIARHIAAALTRAHAEGIVHRDLKPENIVLVAREDDARFAKVIDFGIAKVTPQGAGDTGAPLTQMGMVFGTPDYMAPEQALGSAVDLRADLYAFGIMVFEMLTGRRPFQADDVVTLMGKHISEPVPAASSLVPTGALAPDVDAVFARTLAKSPVDRFASATEFVQALEASLAGLSSTARHSAGAPSAMAIPGGADARPFTIPLTTVAGKAYQTVATHYGTLRRDPVRHRRFVIAATAIVLASILLAALTRPDRGRSTLVSDAPTPVLPRGRHGHGAARAPAASPRESVAPATSPTPSPLPESAPAPTIDPGLPADLAAQLAEYQSRPNVRSLLDAARDRGRGRAAAVAAFETARAQSPDAAIVNYLLGTLYARERRAYGVAIERYADALRLAPGFARDTVLLHDVAQIAVSARAVSPGVLALLTGPLGPTAAPALLDTAMSAPSPAARAQAVAILTRPPFGGGNDPTLNALVGLASARSCEQKIAALGQLQRDGDARALPYLRAITVTPRGCGFLGMSPCNACLSEALPAALSAVEQRAH